MTGSPTHFRWCATGVLIHRWRGSLGGSGGLSFPTSFCRLPIQRGWWDVHTVGDRLCSTSCTLSPLNISLILTTQPKTSGGHQAPVADGSNVLHGTALHHYLTSNMQTICYCQNPIACLHSINCNGRSFSNMLLYVKST